MLFAVHLVCLLDFFELKELGGVFDALEVFFYEHFDDVVVVKELALVVFDTLRRLILEVLRLDNLPRFNEKEHHRAFDFLNEVIALDVVVALALI